MDRHDRPTASTARCCRSLRRCNMDKPKLKFVPSLVLLRLPKPRSPPAPATIELSDVPPRHATDLESPVFPVEIFERIVDFLHSDKAALISCSTVCRAWFPTSRYHLHAALTVVPAVVNVGCCSVNTALSLKAGVILYGTNSGLYLSRGNTPLRVLKLPAVTQIDALEAHDLVLILSGRRLLVGPLHLATGKNAATFYRRLVVLSSDASFFQVGDHVGRPVVCIGNAGRFSSHFKIMEAVECTQPGTWTLKLFRSFYLPDKATSVHIWNKTIGVGLRTGFQCVDPLSLVTFPVPVDAPPAAGARKCRAMFRVDERFLLCYDRCAFFMNKAGASSEAAFALRWQDVSKRFALRAPYLLAFSIAAMRVWDIETGALLQTVHGAITLLCQGPEVLVKMDDGRVVALRFSGGG
ncbi:CNH domain-containing protein [Mycena sp. CBHHK59/15]|nr:CNH domain-containing protein [Mycena sp. CBHHK59/15]